MAKGFACLVLLASAIGLGAQEKSEPSGAVLSKLTLDELIARLPPVGSEWIREGDAWELVPVAFEFRERVEHGAALTAEQWKRVLVSTGVLRLRERWPSTLPLAVSMKEPGWFRLTQVRVAPKEPGLATAEVGRAFQETCGTMMMQATRAWLYQPLGVLPLGRRSLVFDLTLERGQEFRSRYTAQVPEEFEAPAGVFFQGDLAFDVEIVPTLEEAIPPRSTPELDAAVRSALSLAFDDWSDGRTAILVADPDVSGDPRLAHLGLSLAIDILRGSEVVESRHLVPSDYDPLASGISVHEGRGQPFAFAPLESLSPAVENDADARAGWSVRVTGTSEHVLSLWSADSRWSGTLILSLDELIAREREVAPQGRGPWIYMPTFR